MRDAVESASIYMSQCLAWHDCAIGCRVDYLEQQAESLQERLQSSNEEARSLQKQVDVGQQACTDLQSEQARTESLRQQLVALQEAHRATQEELQARQHDLTDQADQQVCSGDSCWRCRLATCACNV